MDQIKKEKGAFSLILIMLISIVLLKIVALHALATEELRTLSYLKKHNKESYENDYQAVETFVSRNHNPNVLYTESRYGTLSIISTLKQPISHILFLQNEQAQYNWEKILSSSFIESATEANAQPTLIYKTYATKGDTSFNAFSTRIKENLYIEEPTQIISFLGNAHIHRLQIPHHSSPTTIHIVSAGTLSIDTIDIQPSVAQLEIIFVSAGGKVEIHGEMSIPRCSCSKSNQGEDCFILRNYQENECINHSVPRILSRSVILYK